ncbi:hypothetical protein DPEC_G00066080 [Dallia pectoralis]|uniref:Uncharacterized protein n=1 Tax=Dallia pectoralis TaxID=75939 RepID=A0ACC2H9F4_DALPE|nr:hypothetical protein DPEC_G00066080 [Dallia pectoralis]
MRTSVLARTLVKQILSRRIAKTSSTSTMPEVKPLRFPSRERGPSLQDQADLQAVCPSRRRSCALVNTPSPCVNRAVCHIQDLKEKLEDWCQQSGNVKHHVSHEKHPQRTTIRIHSSESESSRMSTELYIEGIGLGAREDSLFPPLHKETTNVLVEVVYLIERLEADRQDAEEALRTEKRKRRTLGRRIDTISVWKQQEFPVVVQHEHEACARDIRELKWHLKRRRDKLCQVKEKMTKTEVLNQRLNEDIDFIKINGPLLKEKLQLDRDLLNQINMTQHDANETFSKTSEELQSCQEEMRVEELKADEERAWMLHELKDTENGLNERLAELQELMCQWEGFGVKAEETENTVTLKEKECKGMLLSIPELEVQEAATNDQIVELKILIEMEGRKIAKLEEEIPELQNEVHETRLAGESALALLDEVFCKKCQGILALHQENKEYELDIEDYTKQIYESEQAVKRLQADRKRMLQKISTNERDRDNAQDELSQEATLHAHTKVNLDVLEQQTFIEEQRIRKVMENMKKTLMGEMKTLAILKGKIATFKTELHQEQINTDKARMELDEEFEKASSATKQMEIKTEKLRKMYDDKSTKIDSMNNQLSNILTKKKNTSDCLEQERNLKREHLKSVKELHQAVTKRFDQTVTKITDLTAKSTDYQDASDSMEETASTMPDVIAELQSVFDAAEFKYQTAALIMNTLKRDIANCQQRTEQMLTSHTALFTSRQRNMQEIKADLKESLRENVELAHEHRALQNVLVIAKLQAVCVFDEKNRADESFHDHKQLSLLQKRMHKALVKSFSQRHLYSLAKLSRFQILSNENNQRVKGVQPDIAVSQRGEEQSCLPGLAQRRGGPRQLNAEQREEQRAGRSGAWRRRKGGRRRRRRGAWRRRKGEEEEGRSYQSAAECEGQKSRCIEAQHTVTRHSPAQGPLEQSSYSL